MVCIRKYVPDTITAMNLLCGVLGILFCFEGNLPAAFYCMLAAAVFDFCDGFAARMLGAYSDLGRELDSLCDLVSFGVLPSVMLYCFMNQSYDNAIDPLFNECLWLKRLAIGSPVILAVFSGLRLAKFNVDTRQSDRFLGLATPAAALLLGSFVCFMQQTGDSELFVRLWDWPNVRVYVPVAVIVVSALLVCDLPMFAFKIKRGGSLFRGGEAIMRIVFLALVLVCAVLVAVFRLHFSLFFTGAMLSYIAVNAVGACVRIIRKPGSK